MMKKDLNPLIKPLSFHKQNPIYVKLVILFLLLGITIFLFSSRSVDFSADPQFQTQTSTAVDEAPDRDILITEMSESSNDVPAVDSQETETEAETTESELVESDEGSTSSTSTEVNVDEPASSTSTERHNDEPAPSTSTRPQNDEPAPSTSTESVNNDAASSTSNASSTTTEAHSDEPARSSSTESVNSNATTLTSTELHSDEASSTSSTELHKDEAKAKCDLFKGAWVPNPSGPAYSNYTCLLIDSHQNCAKNGRPDSGYLHWRWKPNDCELPKFNPKMFLEFMRNKYFAFVGDSIARNHVQSIMCILRQVEEPTEIYHDDQFRSNTWIYPSYNFTIARLWAPFLLKAAEFEDGEGHSSADIQLHIDQLDEKWTEEYKKFDYMIISGGQWFMKTAIYYENNKVHGCHNCHRTNFTEMNFDVPYRKAINSVFNFVTNSTHKARVLLRTIAPSHFEGGDWSSGGKCRRKEPFKENEVNMTNVDKLLYDIQVQEFNAAVPKASANGVDLRLFDTTRLSLLRPDGHPGEYRQFQPFAKDKNANVQSDCLHWCLPGPIDSWNDLLMETLMNS